MWREMVTNAYMGVGEGPRGVSSQKVDQLLLRCAPESFNLTKRPAWGAVNGQA